MSHRIPLKKEYMDLMRLAESCVMKDSIVDSVSSASTDGEVPSAKLLYDTVGDIERQLSEI